MSAAGNATDLVSHGGILTAVRGDVGLSTMCRYQQPGSKKHSLPIGCHDIPNDAIPPSLSLPCFAIRLLLFDKLAGQITSCRASARLVQQLDWTMQLTNMTHKVQ